MLMGVERTGYGWPVSIYSLRGNENSAAFHSSQSTYSGLRRDSQWIPQYHPVLKQPRQCFHSWIISESVFLPRTQFGRIPTMSRDFLSGEWSRRWDVVIPPCLTTLFFRYATLLRSELTGTSLTISRSTLKLHENLSASRITQMWHARMIFLSPRMIQLSVRMRCRGRGS